MSILIFSHSANFRSFKPFLLHFRFKADLQTAAKSSEKIVKKAAEKDKDAIVIKKKSGDEAVTVS